MFQKISDYTELLLPDNLLRDGSVIQQMIERIKEEAWKDAVQIIGWLYQYYNSEKKDDVFAALKKNVKITKENIPAATQLFTQDWIVRYMVENSLGRLWLEGHPDAKEQLLPTEEEQSAYVAGNRDSKDMKWHYYLEEAEQEPNVQAQLAEIRKEYAALTPEKLKVIDPCSGSGHILAYMFDVLMKIYESYGYTNREAVASIVERNIYGLDIDDRAAQLAYFAVMMKARQYDSRFFRRGIQPHVYAIVESNHVDRFAVEYFCNGDAKLKAAIDTIISELHDAKEYGSILAITQQNWSALYDRFAEITEDIHMYRDVALTELLPLVQVAEALAQKYDVVVTNPPYRGIGDVDIKLSDFVKKYYLDSKADLFAVFMESCKQMIKKNGYQAMITQQTWMFSSSFKNLRMKMMQNEIVGMIHLGSKAFDEIDGEVVQTTAFVCYKGRLNNYSSIYFKLDDYGSPDEKEIAYLHKQNCYIFKNWKFAELPGSIYSYWVSEGVLNAFKTSKSLESIATPKRGMCTCGNDLFYRNWYEVSHTEFCYPKVAQEHNGWVPLNKGGEFRKWYGNLVEVVDWKDDAKRLRSYPTAQIKNEDFYFLPAITWSSIASKRLSFRYTSDGFIFDQASNGVFPPIDLYYYFLALLNSKAAKNVLTVINPSFNVLVGDIAKIPVVIAKDSLKTINSFVIDLISLSKSDWDSFETSWDFQRHPLLKYAAFTTQMVAQEEVNNGILDAYRNWEQACNDRFNQLKANEEELNRIFIDIYGLQDELTPEVEDKDVTVRKADLGRDIRSFISYAVGCMFGRYSLDIDGLAYAGGEWDAGKYVSFPADKDNIIPICDDEYFEDDIVGLFVDFVKTVYGAETLDENLKFIADALGGKGQPKDVIRKYFLNDFYKDHCKIYQKRPIYWLFDSGKKNGFKALIYMHCYQPDTIARIRTDYVHEQQARYRTAIADMEQRIANADSTGERVKLNKKLTALQAQDAEIRTYEEKIHHLADQMISIDLDDGVKKNYAIFQDVLAKIKY